MAEYSVLFRKSVRKDLSPIPKKDVKRILECIKSLANNPRPPGCEKLSARERYRLRQGVYRIVYSIQDDEQTVWVVGVVKPEDSLWPTALEALLMQGLEGPRGPRPARKSVADEKEIGTGPQ